MSLLHNNFAPHRKTTGETQCIAMTASQLLRKTEATIIALVLTVKNGPYVLHDSYIESFTTRTKKTARFHLHHLLEYATVGLPIQVLQCPSYLFCIRCPSNTSNNSNASVFSLPFSHNYVIIICSPAPTSGTHSQEF